MRSQNHICSYCEGSLSAFFAVFVVAIVAVVGLVADGGRYLAQREQALTEVQQAARVGAGQLSQTQLRLGNVQIDNVKAVEAAEQYMAQSGHPGTAFVLGDQVYAQVSTYSVPTVLLGIIGISHFDVHASASAQTVTGITSSG